MPYRFPAAAISSPVDSSCTAYVSAVDSSSSGSGPFTCAIVFTLYHSILSVYAVFVPRIRHRRCLFHDSAV